jgi:A/G-specific adenine glycosylase
MSSALERLNQATQCLAPVLSTRLVAWQRQEGRHHLPWQQTSDPYRVWLSEIMLQQTQVTTVLGYYDRFLAAFPTVVDLAAAPQDEVLTLWAGLGYYSRARNLHRCAQAVVADHGGAFPGSAALLQTLPGIGPSTAAAIAGFCFQERVTILDGNVKRVLSRALAFGEDLASSKNEKLLWQAASQLVPEQNSDMPSYTQGLMDLGATVCTPRKPNCLLCPWSDVCGARKEGQPEAYPVKTRKLKRSSRESWCLWVEHEGTVWLVQRPEKGVWGGLWTLPMFASQEALSAAYTSPVEVQPPVMHVLTHLDWRLHLSRALVGSKPDVHAWLSQLAEPVEGQGRWVPLAELHQFGLPTPFKRWLVGA